jgi:hypothetical protein
MNPLIHLELEILWIVFTCSLRLSVRENHPVGPSMCMCRVFQLAPTEAAPLRTRQPPGLPQVVKRSQGSYPTEVSIAGFEPVGLFLPKIFAPFAPKRNWHPHSFTRPPPEYFLAKSQKFIQVRAPPGFGITRKKPRKPATIDTEWPRRTDRHW